MSIYKEKFDKDYQKQVGYYCPEELHTNSKELLDILIEHDIIQDNMHIFEIGSGGCRNLKYINDYNPSVKLSANDLFRDASFQEMHGSIKVKVNFYEKDTLSLVREVTPDPIDLLISSDHLMHIDEESVKEIMEVITKKWQPKYILLREIKPSGHKINRKYPRLCHNFDFKNYSILDESASITQPSLYYVRLYHFQPLSELIDTLSS